MRSPEGTARPGITSELLDLSSVSLAQLRNLRTSALRRSVRHVVARTAHTAVLASGSQGGGPAHVA